MENNLSKARDLFNTAHVNKEDCNALIELTKNSENIVIRGYNAAALMVSSKYQINPFKISKIFNEGKVLLEDLISENFDDVELRYLRFTIQLNTPKFVGYNKTIENDRRIITNYLILDLNTDLAKHIMIYVNNTKDEIGDAIKKEKN